ncbi:cupin domain-containing protein [bacterium endosymbiont of Escarpia laminata]|nr:MAG: cupin domain-containing protein [bacterium endosymbiont of Escarpia laminata]
MQTLNFPNGLTAEQFLAVYWQQKPLLFRQALPDFRCHLEPDELAGLACEEDVESRLVLEKHGSTPWEARHGPFDDETFSKLPESHWTLLVQDVDKHLPEVARLTEYFRFLPDWRFDDVMVSYAVDQGSVGPHIDDYDVFLFQAKGRRRWKIHYQRVTENDYIPGLDLRILPEFNAEDEWLLEPGDMLYLPPNVAHWGVAEGECLSCSIGFQAPAFREMAAAWCEELVQHRIASGRLRDKPLKPQSASAEIKPQALEQIRTLLGELLTEDSDHQRRWFGRFITEGKLNLQVEAQDQPLDPNIFHNRFREVAVIHRNPYTRLAFSRGDQGNDSLFANGKEYLLPSDEGDFLPVITHYQALHYGYLEVWLEQPDYLQLVCDLYNDGHFGFPDD